jgi:hemolysin III
MRLFDLREPINALSHGAGMILALPVTWVLWRCCHKLVGSEPGGPVCAAVRYHRVKSYCMLVFGITLTICYGMSAAFHGVRLGEEALSRLQRLDHVGIYLLIAGTYTPVAWALMRGTWTWGTLTTVWAIALACAFRVWHGGLMPTWVSTPVYLAMGWGALFCYFELAKSYPHSTLLPLPLGGLFYSIGAIFNLLRWPVLLPGVLGAHELLHFLVIAGSACHIFFMGKVVAPAPASSRSPAHVSIGLPTQKTRRERATHPANRWLPHIHLQGRPAKNSLNKLN